jgi:signal peptidase I
MSSSNNDPIIEFLDYAIDEIKIFLKDSFFNLLMIVSFITFVANITSTPTTSMYPTIKKGDWFILLKCAYGFNSHSFDMGPFGISHNYFWKNLFTYIPQKKILTFRGIKQGDVISFKTDFDLRTGFLKRAIAVAGDIVTIEKGLLIINNKPIIRKFLRSKQVKKKNKLAFTFEYFQETLPNGVTYITRYIKDQENKASNNIKNLIIPEGFCLAMGDNRDQSDDSRDNIGLVPINNISGKGFLIFFSKSSKLSLFTFDLKKVIDSVIKLPKNIKWKRIFTFL